MQAIKAKTEMPGMKVIPVGERKCIWMEAGVVSYKLCTNQFQCNSCQFDRAMSNRAQEFKQPAVQEHPMGKSRKEIKEWMVEFKELPGEQRKCRYMLMGEVSHKICPNSFRCGECTFDQMMQDRVQPRVVEDNQSLPMVGGFYLSDGLYYFRNHTWLQLERNGQYRIGIDDFARRLLGKADKIDLPPLGRGIDMEEYCLTIHHHYGDLEFFSPLKGVVSSINYRLGDDSSVLTEQPYSNGWLMTVEPENIGKSLKNFLSGKEARAWMVEEANLLFKGIGGEAGATLHDGAAPVADISQHLDRAAWQKIVKERLYTR